MPPPGCCVCILRCFGAWWCCLSSGGIVFVAVLVVVGPKLWLTSQHGRTSIGPGYMFRCFDAAWCGLVVLCAACLLRCFGVSVLLSLCELFNGRCRGPGPGAPGPVACGTGFGVWAGGPGPGSGARASGSGPGHRARGSGPGARRVPFACSVPKTFFADTEGARKVLSTFDLESRVRANGNSRYSHDVLLARQ